MQAFASRALEISPTKRLSSINRSPDKVGNIDKISVEDIKLRINTLENE